jgi:hypothetical protein
LSLALDGARADGRDEARQARLGLEFTNPLRRGGNRDANLVPLRLARNAAERSSFEIEGLALALCARIANAYWDLYAARARIALYRESLDIARRELEELTVRVEVGQASENDTSLVEAEVARRKELLIDAEATAVDRRLQLLRLMGRPDADWMFDIEPNEPMPAPDGRVPEPAEIVLVALARRPESPGAPPAESGELECVRTADGLLPKLDFFLGLGKSGYADSFGGQFDGLGDRAFDAKAGLTWSDTPDRRAATARHRLAGLTVAERRLAIANLEAAIGKGAPSAQRAIAPRPGEGDEETRYLPAARRSPPRSSGVKVGRSTPFAWPRPPATGSSEVAVPGAGRRGGRVILVAQRRARCSNAGVEVVR